MITHHNCLLLHCPTWLSLLPISMLDMEVLEFDPAIVEHDPVQLSPATGVEVN